MLFLVEYYGNLFTMSVKKVFFIFIGIFFCLSLSFSESLKQYQTFSWKKVSKAKKYEITIEKEISEGEYQTELSQQLKDNRVELLLYPGNYRVAISVFNALGKKASTTDWTKFIILNETDPYLFPNAFAQSARWKAPVLKVHGEGISTVEEEDDEGIITARAGDPTNSFPVKGKNIFFEKTSFRLVPKAQTEKGVAFESFNDMKPDVPLTIVRRDTEKSEVIVKYDFNRLYSGYYDLIVENPGENKTSMEILVLSNESPEIDGSIYEYDKNYKVNVLTVQKGQPFDLTVRGTGFDGSTVYSLTPDKGIIPYPFASEIELLPVAVTLDSHKSLDSKGTIELNLKVETDGLQTGYYKLEAVNGFSGSDSQLFLVKTISAPNKKPTLSKFKTKASDTEIMYNINGKKIEKGSKFTLIAPYSEENDGNKKIQLKYIDSKWGRSLHILQSDRQSIAPGRYAVYVESKMGSSVVYVDIDEDYQFTKAETTEEEMASLFLRPENKPFTVEKKQKIIESHFATGSEKVKYFNGLRMFVPSLQLQGSFYFDTGKGLFVDTFDGGGKLDLFYFKWGRIDAGVFGFNQCYSDKSGCKFGIDARFEIPWRYLKPYIGGGFYVATNGDMSVPVEAGILFLDYMSISYQISFEGINTGRMYAVDKLSIGIQIPLGKMNYSKVSEETYADIAENNSIVGYNYKIENNTTALILDSREISGFAGMEKIKTVRFSENVKTIRSRAFADMKNLSTVKMYDGITVIESQAFMNDTKIKEIIIPKSVVKIEDGVFDGWTQRQTVKLLWNSDDESKRELSGLQGINAKIIFLDGVEMKNLSGENE